MASRNGGLSIEIMQRIVENKAEFDGRFFVKIHKDLTLQYRLVGNISDAYYAIHQSRATPYINSRSAYCHSGTYDNSGNGSNVAWHGFDLEGNMIISIQPFYYSEKTYYN